MILIKTQGKSFPLEEKFPIELEYKNLATGEVKKYKLIITKNGGLLINKA